MIVIMRILIYGAGSVGLGIASCLLKSGAGVDVVTRQETVDSLRVHGLVRTGIFGDFEAPPSAFGAYTSLDKIQNAQYDYILVCTKSFDSLGAAQDLYRHSRLIEEATKIVLFQNGWNNAGKFTSFFHLDQIYNARVITGFGRPKKNEVVITVHADSIHIGSLFGPDLACMEKLCQFISAGDIPCQITQDIEKDLWAKMLYNCALNPLGAILDVPYGRLARSEFTRGLMDAIITEVFEVIAAAGYRTHWQRPADFIEVFYEKLVPDTAEHTSSTLQDILAKKPTEIDALNGAVIKLAHRRQIAVPYNLAVYNMVKFIEAKTR
jgi:2-dehydropantoate 2-reductase